ncbi:MAG: tagaturonate epimerase family protein [Ignavibacteriales bacterium]|nr:tagaturonate epimerase family protein [Ignavibacteriales bacterium]
MILEKYSIGVGDRFGHQGAAQLQALEHAAQRGVQIVPVWNKSFREHTIVGTKPADTRIAADSAVKERSWRYAHYVDADHISLKNVDLFLDSSNFYTLDVADFIGKAAEEKDIEAFVRSMMKHTAAFPLAGVHTTTKVTEDDLYAIGRKYLFAVKEAGRIYRHIATKKGEENFVAEVSTDEANEPQTPAQLFFILAALAEEGVRVQTIAPKFTGSFLKGIDYVGSVEKFTTEFEEDLLVIEHAIKTFDLPKNLKLSVHSGSDKFSLYPVIRRAMQKQNAGLHLKTAGTTWLEELIGLASAGGEGLKIAQEIYATAFSRIDELCKPYETVINIDRSKLPDPQKIQTWGSDDYACALRHNQTDPRYNLHFRQLLHVGYKVAAEMGDRYIGMLVKYRDTIANNVSENLYQRHIVPLFFGT